MIGSGIETALGPGADEPAGPRAMAFFPIVTFAELATGLARPHAREGVALARGREAPPVAIRQAGQGHR